MALLLHTEPDSSSRIRQINRLALGLKVVDQSCKPIKTAAFRRAILCFPNAFQLFERCLIVRFEAD